MTPQTLKVVDVDEMVFDVSWLTIGLGVSLVGVAAIEGHED